MVSKMSEMSKSALPPLQRLEHSMHPLVSFVVMPIFAFANAGVTIEGEFLELLLSPVTLGVILGLLIGKVTGIFGITFLLIKTKLAKLPDGMNLLHLLGASVLAAIGF